LALSVALVGCSNPRPVDNEPIKSDAVAANEPASAPTKSTKPVQSKEPPKKPEPNVTGSKGPGYNEAVDHAMKVLGPERLKALPDAMFKPSKGTWHTNKLTASQLASQLEGKLSTLSAISGVAHSAVVLGGGHGGGEYYFAIKDPKHFKAEYATMLRKPVAGTRRESLVASDGKFAILEADNSLRSAKPYEAMSQFGASNPAEWAETFGRNVFAALGGAKPFTNLVELASKPNSGLTVKAEEQLIQARGQTLLQRRLLVTRTQDAEKKLGPFEVEVVSDGRLQLPVTVRVDNAPTGQQPTQLYWTARWNLRPGQIFEQDAFKIPSSKVADRKTVTART
jgi:hypothetical protein